MNSRTSPIACLLLALFFTSPSAAQSSGGTSGLAKRPDLLDMNINRIPQTLQRVRQTAASGDSNASLQVAQALENYWEEVRTEAAAQLAALGDRRTIPFLIRAVRRGTGSAEPIIKALLAIDPETHAQLADILSSHDYFQLEKKPHLDGTKAIPETMVDIRIAVARQLEPIQEAAVSAAMRQAIATAERARRTYDYGKTNAKNIDRLLWTASQALGRRGDAGAKHLLELLPQASDGARLPILYGLGLTGSHEVRTIDPSLIESPRANEATLTALAYSNAGLEYLPSSYSVDDVSQGRASLPNMLAGLRSADRSIRYAAARKLSSQFNIERYAAVRICPRPKMDQIDFGDGDGGFTTCSVGVLTNIVISRLALTPADSAIAAGAYKVLIRSGAPQALIPLVDGLEEFGDKQMAVDFLNSGNGTLTSAATIWARKRGLAAQSTQGHNFGPRWGAPN